MFTSPLTNIKDRKTSKSKLTATSLLVASVIVGFLCKQQWGVMEFISGITCSYFAGAAALIIFGKVNFQL